MNLGSVGNITSRMHLDSISHAHAQVTSDSLVGTDFLVLLLFIFGDERDADSLLSLLSLEQDTVSLEELEFVHFRLGELNSGVVVQSRFFSLELVGRLLLFENSA